MSERFINKKVTKYLCWAEEELVSEIDLLTINDLVKIILDYCTDMELEMLRAEINTKLDITTAQKITLESFNRIGREAFNQTKDIQFKIVMYHNTGECFVYSTTPIAVGDIFWLGDKIKDNLTKKCYKVNKIRETTYLQDLLIFEAIEI